MIGIDDDLDWGGALSDSESEYDGVEVITNITPEGSIREQQGGSKKGMGNRSLTDITPEGSVEDPNEINQREAALREFHHSENHENKRDTQKQLDATAKRQLRSHHTADNIDASANDERNKIRKDGTNMKSVPVKTVLHSVSVPVEQTEYVLSDPRSRGNSPHSSTRKAKVAPDTRETSHVEQFHSSHLEPPPQRRILSPSNSLSRVAPHDTQNTALPSGSSKSSDLRSPTGVTSPPHPHTQQDSTTTKKIATVDYPPVPMLSEGKIWNQLSFRLKPQFAGFTEVHSFANAVRIVPGEDGARVLCATADSTIRLIDATTGRVLSMFEGHSDRVLAVAVSEYVPPTGRGVDGRAQVVVGGSRDETVCIWDLKSARCRHILSLHEGAVWAVGVTTRVARPVAVSGSSDCTLRSWDIETGEAVSVFKGHSDTVLALAIHAGSGHAADPPRVVSGGADFMVRVWDLLTGRHCIMLEGHTDDVNAISLVVDPSSSVFHGVKIVSGSRDRTVRVWDLSRGLQLAEFHGHTDCVYGVAGIIGKFTSLIPSSTGEQPPSLVHGTKSGVGELNKQSSVWIRPDEGGLNRGSDASFLVVSCGEDRTIRVWNVLEEKQMVVSKQHKGSVKGISALPVKMKAADGTTGSAMLLVTCSWDKSVMFYDLDNLLKKDTKQVCCTVS